MAVIFINHKTPLYYYWAALVLTVTYLNSCKAYLPEPYKWFNALFLVYLIFVVWESTRHYHFSPTAELWLNNLEHILFAVMICFIATHVLKLSPFNIRSFAIRLFADILIFNVVNSINAGFQNALQHRSIFTLIPDSQKDIKMHVMGSLLFLVAALLLKKMMMRRAAVA